MTSLALLLLTLVSAQGITTPLWCAQKMLLNTLTAVSFQLSLASINMTQATGKIMEQQQQPLFSHE